jgi:hypothetical protein
MLIVGDVPYKNDIDPDFDVRAVEVIVSPENREQLFEELNLDKTKQFIKLSDWAEITMQNGMKHIIMSADNAYLRILMKENMAINRLRLATPGINYAYLWFLARMRRYDPLTWLKVVRQTKELKPFFYNTYRQKKQQFKLLKCGERLGVNYFSRLKQFQLPYTPNGFIKYDKYAILAGMGQTMNSPYKRMTIPGPLEFFNENIFNTYTDLEKKIAVLETIYLHLISEIFVAEMFISNKYPDPLKWKWHFIESMMDITTSDRNGIDFIQTFIYENVDTLIESFRPKLIENFINAEKNKEILPVKTWIEE